MAGEWNYAGHGGKSSKDGKLQAGYIERADVYTNIHQVFPDKRRIYDMGAHSAHGILRRDAPGSGSHVRLRRLACHKS